VPSPPKCRAMELLGYDASLCMLVGEQGRPGMVPQTHQRTATLPPAARDEVVAAGTAVSAAQRRPLHPWAPEAQKAAPETQRSVDAMAVWRAPQARHDVGDELIHREASGAWPEAPPPGF